VPKEELMDAVWGGRFVTEAAVTSRIKQARRAMGDDGRGQRLIRTVHGRGYRFIAEVIVEAASGTEPVIPSAADRNPTGVTAPIRYTVSDGLHIAYQVTGGGDDDIVLISGFVSHLELDWADHWHAHFLDRLGSMGRLIRFDKRGTGGDRCPIGHPESPPHRHDLARGADDAQRMTTDRRIRPDLRGARADALRDVLVLAPGMLPFGIVIGSAAASPRWC